jgi:hypothetical protein
MGIQQVMPASSPPVTIADFVEEQNVTGRAFNNLEWGGWGEVQQRLMQGAFHGWCYGPLFQQGPCGRVTVEVNRG